MQKNFYIVQKIIDKNKDTMALSDAYNIARQDGICLEIEGLIEFLKIQEDVRNAVFDKRREFK